MIFNILPYIIIASGAYFFIRLRGFFFLRPKPFIKDIASELRTKESRSSLVLALAGTLGVGNIVGVAVGIRVGGPGMVLWLILSSIFSSVIKYAEVTVTLGSGANGMADVIDRSYPKSKGALGMLYALLCLLLSFAMGAALQSGSIGDSINFAYGIPRSMLIAPTVIIVLILVLGNGKKIEKSVNIIIPLTTIIYIIMCLCVILPNINSLGNVIKDIFYSAFNFKSAGVGTGLGLGNAAMREGFARGMLSNEAGAGTSSLAHSKASGRESCVGGTMGVVEVFFDTLILCPLSAFAILLSGEDGYGFELIGNTFQGRVFASRHLLCLCIICFALSTVLGWFYYGLKCAERLRIYPLCFTVMFLIALGMGMLLSQKYLITLSDLLLLLMSIMTIAALIKNASFIIMLSKKYIMGM